MSQNPPGNDHCTGSRIQISFFICAFSEGLVVVERQRWRLLAPHAPSVRGGSRGLCHKEPSHPHRGDNSFVFIPEIPVEQAIDDGIETAVEVGHEVADHKEPLGDAGRNVGRVYGDCQADQVKRRPANGEQHEDHEHGDEVSHVTRSEARAFLCLHFTSNLDDEKA